MRSWKVERVPDRETVRGGMAPGSKGTLFFAGLREGFAEVD